MSLTCVQPEFNELQHLLDDPHVAEDELLSAVDVAGDGVEERDAGLEDEAGLVPNLGVVVEGHGAEKGFHQPLVVVVLKREIV